MWHSERTRRARRPAVIDVDRHARRRRLSPGAEPARPRALPADPGGHAGGGPRALRGAGGGRRCRQALGPVEHQSRRLLAGRRGRREGREGLPEGPRRRRRELREHGPEARSRRQRVHLRAARPASLPHRSARQPDLPPAPARVRHGHPHRRPCRELHHPGARARGSGRARQGGQRPRLPSPLARRVAAGGRALPRPCAPERPRVGRDRRELLRGAGRRGRRPHHDRGAERPRPRAHRRTRPDRRGRRARTASR